MTHAELAATVADMRATAVRFVERHAAVYARDVAPDVVAAVCDALGDISIDEATAALDREQQRLEREGRR